MKLTSLPFCLALLLIFLFLTWTSALAQIRFAQITDLHIYDGRKESPEGLMGDDENDTKKVLLKCIQKINELHRKSSLQFVAVTGDLGLENILKGVLLDSHPSTQISEEDKKKLDQALRTKAKQLAGVLKHSEVSRWLFVPGNNDLLDENPKSIVHYHQFISILKSELAQKQIEVIDLCPTDENGDSKSYAYRIKNYTFVGFNNATFKNQNDASRLTDGQAKYVEDVMSVLTNADSNVYLFFHEPGVDDPYLASTKPDNNLLRTIRGRLDNRTIVGHDYVYSAWFVTPGVRRAWSRLVNDERVKGLFAGHLHDWKEETYLNLRWMRSFAYPPAELLKLHICPPLSKKLQDEKQTQGQARGFQIVSIDSAGRILGGKGQSGVQIFWYNERAKKKNRQFEKTVSAAKTLNELALGQFFEATEHFDEARTAYEAAGIDPLAQESLSRLPKKPSHVGDIGNKLTLDDWSKVATIGACVVAVLALLYTALQVKLGAKISRANFWLEIRKMFAEHQAVHLKLRNEEWSITDDHFPNEDDWSRLEAYMGLFEHCEFMLDEKLLDWTTFKEIYGYRLLLIVNNPIIVREKLINRRSGWKKFICLLKRMDNDIPSLRYLSACWNSTKGKGFVWWGSVHHQECYREFTIYDDLEAGYHKVLTEMTSSDRPPTYAWLRKDWNTIHKWP